MDRRRRSLRFLLPAAVFLLISVAASRWPTEPPGAAEEVEPVVRFPRDMPPRRKNPRAGPTFTSTRTPKRPSDPAAPPPAPPAAEPLAADAFERSLFPPDGPTSVVVEVNAIRHSPLAEKLLRCRSGDLMEGLEKLEKQFGIDPLEDLDRIGLGGDALAVSGRFERLVLPPEVGEGSPYGDAGSIHQIGDQWVGRAGGSLLFVADRRELIEQAIDRAEGRAESAPPPDAQLQASEAFALLKRDLLDEIWANSNDPLGQRLRELLTHGTARMLVDDEVSLSLDLTSLDASTADDLARSVGGALAALRIDAEQRGDKQLAGLLSHARVLPTDGVRFGIDVALPGDFVLDLLGCRADGSPKPKPAGE